MRNGAILPLRLHDVSFAAGGRTIIDGISLEIEAGPSTIILGANGAGKSVLMRLMHGLLVPSAGSVEWNAAEHPGAPRKQAMVFQRPVMLRRSAQANVAYAVKVAGIPKAHREPMVRERRHAGHSDPAPSRHSSQAAFDTTARENGDALSYQAVHPPSTAILAPVM